MSWLFSQALVEEFSADTCSDGEPSAQLNVMPTPRLFWRGDKPMEFSRLSRFGLTWKPLTQERGADVLTWFLAAFPVRTSRSPAVVTDSTVRDLACGGNSIGLFAMWNQATSTWRTAQLSLLGDSDEFSETWPRAGSMRNGECFLRPMLAPLTCASVSGSWPTPVATMHKGWSVGHNRAETDDRLDYTVEREAHRAGTRGRLNPMWVEWLMGWPLGWTDLRPLEMVRFHEWQRQHGHSSRNATRFAAMEVNQVKHTKFQQWLDQVTVAEVSRRMTALGIEYSCTVSAVYQWRKGETVPRPEKIRGLVKISRGQLTLKDVHDHIDAATADWRGRQEVNA